MGTGIIENLKKQKLRKEAERIASELTEIKQAEDLIARAKSDRTNKRRQIESRYKLAQQLFFVSSPLSVRLAKFYLNLARVGDFAFSKWDELVKQFGLKEYFDGINSRDTEKKLPPHFDENDNLIE